jgi:hypothetical protein
MSRRRLRCVACGAVWISEPAQDIVEHAEACLRCAGALAVADETLPDSGPERPQVEVTNLTGEMLTWAHSREARKPVPRPEEP